MDRHGGARHNKAVPGRHGQRHADGMAAAQHKADGRLPHARHKLRNRKAGLHVSADGVEDHEQAVDGRVLLNGDKLRDHMLIFRRLVL